MPRIEYKTKKFGADRLAVIRRARAICEDYEAQGFNLTLRQLYYQFVARGWLPENTQREYKKLGDTISDARMAGLIDWDHIVDRTRNVRIPSAWDGPEEIVRGSAQQFAIDKWDDQPTRVEVWVEKDALIGVIEQASVPEQVPFFSCRGYTSISAVWGAAQRIGRTIRKGQDLTVIHLGDHDPSGLDMTRDIDDRLVDFIHSDNWRVIGAYDNVQAAIDRGLEPLGHRDVRRWAKEDPDGYKATLDLMDEEAAKFGTLTINRIALNFDQVQQYAPPPNFAKLTDSRSKGYIAEYGPESWELDALDPATLTTLISDTIAALRDDEAWDAAVEREDAHKAALQAIADNWDQVNTYVREELA